MLIFSIIIISINGIKLYFSFSELLNERHTVTSLGLFASSRLRKLKNHLF
jgi:hypothetical protein